MRPGPAIAICAAVLLTAASARAADRAAAAPMSAAPTSTAPASTAPTPGAASPYASSADCAACHKTIARFWSESRHSQSAVSPAFLEALKSTANEAADATAARRDCLWCHAPTTIVTGDLAMQLPITREGITCDFCHTVVDVDMEKADGPFVLEPGDVKRGPYRYSKPVGHETAYSALHRASPLLCAACHEYVNARGVAVLSTYSEWKAGPYPARGVPCQDCHMALVPGSVAVGAGDEGLRLVNQHRLVGGSARSQLARGLDLKLEPPVRSGSQATITVVVTNAAAGHAIPGGLSTKSLILEVGVDMGDGRLEHRQERTYRRELKDAGGKVLTRIPDMFTRASSVGRDTRIGPRESKREKFTLPLPAGARALVARLVYKDASDPASPPVILPITEVRHELNAR